MAVDGLSVDQVKSGFRRLVESDRHREFPPNPMTFRALCLPTSEELGLPANGAAFWQATHWSQLPPDKKHPAVLMAMRSMDQAAFRRMDSNQAEKTFMAAWSAVIERVMAGESLPEIPVEIAERPAKAARDTASAGIADLQALFPKQLTTRQTTLSDDLNDRSWAN